LKAVVYLCEENYPKVNQVFLEKNGISFFHLGTHGNKEPFQFIPDHVVLSALDIILDVRNHPILVHCNKGTVSFVIVAAILLTLFGSIEQDA
jgi:tyrosine-protein phosphatase SIW14